jgi:hypothetical protein
VHFGRDKLLIPLNPGRLAENRLVGRSDAVQIGRAEKVNLDKSAISLRRELMPTESSEALKATPMPTAQLGHNSPSKMFLILVLCAIAVPIMVMFVPPHPVVDSEGHVFRYEKSFFVDEYFVRGVTNGFSRTGFDAGFLEPWLGYYQARFWRMFIDVTNPTPFVITIGLLLIAWKVWLVGRRRQRGNWLILTVLSTLVVLWLVITAGSVLGRREIAAIGFYSSLPFMITVGLLLLTWIARSVIRKGERRGNWPALTAKSILAGAWLILTAEVMVVDYRNVALKAHYLEQKHNSEAITAPTSAAPTLEQKHIKQFISK